MGTRRGFSLSWLRTIAVAGSLAIASFALLSADSQNVLWTNAVNVAIVSGMEVVLFSYAQNHDLLQKKLPRDVYRYGAAMSLAPVLFFMVSIPIAFVSTTLAVCVWFLGIPLAAISERWKPEDADELLPG